jgi:hypothetical protein
VRDIGRGCLLAPEDNDRVERVLRERYHRRARLPEQRDVSRHRRLLDSQAVVAISLVKLTEPPLYRPAASMTARLTSQALTRIASAASESSRWPRRICDGFFHRVDLVLSRAQQRLEPDRRSRITRAVIRLRDIIWT